jgi:hypothetical protein
MLEEYYYLVTLQESFLYFKQIWPNLLRKFYEHFLNLLTALTHLSNYFPI